MNDWREDLKRVLLQAGVKEKPTTFLFSDIQVRVCTSVRVCVHVQRVCVVCACEGGEEVCCIYIIFVFYV